MYKDRDTQEMIVDSIVYGALIIQFATLLAWLSGSLKLPFWIIGLLISFPLGIILIMLGFVLAFVFLGVIIAVLSIMFRREV